MSYHQEMFDRELKRKEEALDEVNKQLFSAFVDLMRLWEKRKKLDPYS